MSGRRGETRMNETEKEEKNYLHRQEIYMEMDEHPIRRSIRAARECIINFMRKKRHCPVLLLCCVSVSV